MNWQRVFGTFEEPQTLSTGDWLGDSFPGAALPSAIALYRWIIIRYKNSWTFAKVMDVGPFCIDDSYWTMDRKPRAEINKGMHVPKSLSSDETCKEVSNGAGIDLFPYTAKCLSMTDNDWVEWKFATADILQ